MFDIGDTIYYFIPYDEEGKMHKMEIENDDDAKQYEELTKNNCIEIFEIR